MIAPPLLEALTFARETLATCDGKYRDAALTYLDRLLDLVKK